MASLNDLADKIRKLFSQANITPSSVARFATNPIGSAINYAIPQIAQSVGKVSSQPIAQSSPLYKFGTGVQNLNKYLETAPVIGKIGYQIPKNAGTQAADLMLGGFQQTFNRNPQPSQIPFTNIKVPNYLAGPAKMGLGALSLTPLAAAGTYASELTQGGSEKIPGLQGTFVPQALGIGAGLLTPGGGGKQKSIMEAQKLVNLKKEGEVLLKALPKEKRLAHSLEYSTALITRGFSKQQVEKIGVNEAAAIIKNEITPVERFGNTAILKTGARSSVDESNKFLQEMTGGAPLSKLTFNFSKPLEEVVQTSDLNVKNKVSLLDYFRTPDRVLQKIGLGDEATSLKKSYENYLIELPKEINKITEWSKRVKPGSEVSIFRYLDGKKIKLDPVEQQVALEIKSYLSEWADKLNLPKEGRITNYITHIFERDFIEKEFDPDLAKIIQDKVAGSVYDPFTQKRLGKQEYVEDVFRALDAYVKRGTRKYSMDPVLKVISDKSDSLETSQYNYLKNYIDRVNLRPTGWDNLLDNQIKQMVGYRFGQRPTTVISQKLRQMVFRGTLGLNPGSAIRNLTQGINTYAALGEKYTLLGYMNMVKKAAAGSDELQRVGVLKDEFIQDRTLNATRKFWEKADKALFVFFDMAEKVNRGAAYWGAKAKALDKGMNEQEAIDYAVEIVRKTQFSFGSVHTPLVLSSDLAKTVGQFQSFNIKQAEFLGELIKDKEFLGLIRFGAASVATLLTVGKVIGLKPSDMVPFGSVLTGETKLGQTPTIKLVGDLAQTAVGAPDKYGNQPKWEDRMKTLMGDLVPLIPAGVQIKKTITGLGDVSRGYSQTSSGDVKYPVGQGIGNFIRGGVLGPYNVPEASNYYDNNRRPLSEKQSQVYKQSSDQLKTYQDLMAKREENAIEEKAKELIRTTGQNSWVGGSKYLYLDPESGDVKTIDTSFKPTKPELTGNYLLDKKLITKYKGEITKASNNIAELYAQNQITHEDAEKELVKLSGLKDGLSTAKDKKGKKLTIKGVKLAKPKAFKLTQTRATKFKLPSTKTYTVKKPRTAKLKYPTTKIANIKLKKEKNSLANVGSRILA